MITEKEINAHKPQMDDSPLEVFQKLRWLYLTMAPLLTKSYPVCKYCGQVEMSHDLDGKCKPGTVFEALP